VVGSKVGNGSLAGADLGANSVGGAQVNEASLAGVNATQLGGQAQDAFGGGVVMGRINGLLTGTSPQFGSPAGVSSADSLAQDVQLVTVPNQVIRDFEIVDQDLGGPPPVGDGLIITIQHQGTDIGSCNISSAQFPGCSVATSSVIPDAGVNSLLIEVQASDSSLFAGDDLLFAYRLTPAP
jgi:hypothetical protein